MRKQVSAFCRREAVLCAAAVCALATMAAVPPDGAYAGYIDVRVLCLLACLMAVVAGARACGAFQYLAAGLLRRGGGRTLGVTLVLLPFFCSMAVTNDVALLTFVPFTLLVLEAVDCRAAAVPLLVLQTLAANLGSMATPVGNPQNLYLYGVYGLTAREFFSAVLPLAALSLVGLTLAAVPVLPRTLAAPDLADPPRPDARALALYGGLFALCLLTVFRVLPYPVVTAAVLGTLALVNPKLLRQLDFGLLATFVCFFIVSGNLGRLEGVRTALQALLARSTLATAVLTSQIVSNVPAAVLLSGFTDRWRPLLQGVNIGGLGTPIASLASLISLKQYLRWPGARPGRYLLVFTAANGVGLAVLLLAASLLGA